MSDKIRVTVDGEPVSAEVSWEQVRAYLRAKGWELEDERDGLQMWVQGPHTIWMEGREVRRVLNAIACHEGRHTAAVLRGAEPDGVEALSEEELAALDRSDEEWQRTASGFDAVTVRRLLATVRAREAEIDRLRRLFGPIVNSATMLANARDTGEHEAQRVRHELLTRKIHEP